MLAVFLLVGVTQVQANQPASQDWPHRLATIGNRLVFKTTEDYRRAVDDPDERTREQFLDAVRMTGFLSHADVTPPGSALRIIPDDYFAAIVNPDLCVQIEDHIYRINPITDKVYVLPAELDGEYESLLAEDMDNPHLLEFGSADDVLDAVTDPRQAWWAASRGVRWFCTENPCGARNDTTDVTWVDPVDTFTYRMSGSVRYVKLGIYFTMKAQGLLQVEDTNGWHVATNELLGLTLEPVHYKPKCGTVVGPYNTSAPNLGSTLFQSYQGSKALSRYRMRARFDARQVSRWVEIRCVY